MIKLSPKSHSFLSDSQISCGNAPKKLTSVAPMPSTIKSEGSAQQRSVPKLVKSESHE
jgi:hypothetical protein